MKRIFIIAAAAVFFIGVALPRTSSAALVCAPDVNLRQGNKNASVLQLQKYLNTDPATRVASTGSGSIGNETSNYGPATSRAVKKYQEKYSQYILVPLGYTAGTGTYGNQTRTYAVAHCIDTTLGSSTTTSDVVSPTVSISEPASNSNVSGLVAINAMASDDVGVTSVDFFKNGTLFETVTSPIYIVKWDSTLEPNGTYNWHVKAHDAAGNTTNSAVLVLTSNNSSTPPPTTSAPSVTLSASATSVVSGGATTLTWSSQKAIYCVSSGDWNPAAKSLSGSESTGPLTVGKTYILSCTDGVTSASSSVKINVANATDTVSPAVTLLSPQNGATVSGAVTISASASDDVGVTSVDFFQNGVLYSTDTSAPYTAVWNSANQTNGTYNWHVKAHDAAGNSTNSNVISLNLSNSVVTTAAPTVNLTAASTNLSYNTFTNVIWSSVNATSCTASGAWTGTKATSGTYPTGNLTSSQTYYITCTGPGGSASRNITLFVVGTQDAVPPTVSITSPTPNTSVSGTVTIAANASDNTGVAKVEILVDGSIVATDTAAPYTANWAAPAVSGSHTIVAKAYDAAGNSTPSSVSVQTTSIGTPLPPSGDTVFSIKSDGKYSLSYKGTPIAIDQLFGPMIFGTDPNREKTLSIVVDAPNKKITWKYAWGNYYLTIVPNGNNISLQTKIENTSSGTTLDGYGLSFGGWNFPAGSGDAIGGAPIEGFSQAGPAIATYNWNGGSLSMVEDTPPSTPVLMVMNHAGSGDQCPECRAPLYKTVNTDGNQDRPIFKNPLGPGQTQTFNSSWRLGATDFSDVNATYRQTFPVTVNWPDRRIIGSVFLATNDTSPVTNPNGWRSTGGPEINVTTQAGLAAFRTDRLKLADGIIAQMKKVDAQGIIIWDIEGRQSKGINYVGDPVTAETFAPEWSYTTNGVKLIDEFLKKFTDAGLKIGMTLRWADLRQINGAWQQTYPNDPVKMLGDKVGYARNRWGAKLFYVDSSDPYSLDTYQKVHAMYPDVLLIPEQNRTSTYSSASAYRELRGGVTGTPSDVLAVYPNAFITLWVNDANNPTATQVSNIIQGIKRGDIMLVHWWDSDRIKVWYDQSKLAFAPAPKSSLAAVISSGTQFAIGGVIALILIILMSLRKKYRKS